ncbi:MAG: 16S rRNA (guanine(966)-N(2))-methyltransferase RsmD [Bacteroidota bacterium]
MRITGGTYKGRRFHIKKGLPVRPTTDRTREALFNMLSHRLELSRTSVLDLFCGTGIVSAEFLSRGAVFVTGVDKNRGCIQSFKRLAETLKEESKTKGICKDCRSFCKQTEESWDVIFMDPPYALSGIPDLIQLIFQRKLLNADGMCIVEHDPKLRLDAEEFHDYSKVYGSSALSFFRYEV